MTTDPSEDHLLLPARAVVRAVLPASTDLRQAGQDVFAWLDRHHTEVTGPNVEDHLMDADAAQATVLEVTVNPRRHIRAA
ncbi:hypothetical protein [Nonomuraea insulae]|uniref:Uncharacterized protein n=1 Tax=Nonomuraea insulae TaxID=1616787 RepID=A0ABW1D6Y8_9ACTN